jgi:glyoxylate/succinic semialdehyde reductase
LSGVNIGPTLLLQAKFLIGEVGQGTRIKLVVNMMLGTMMSTLAEGITLARASDLSADILLQVLDLGAMANPMFKGKGPAMLKDTFPPSFPLKHQQKDMKYVLILNLMLILIAMSILMSPTFDLHTLTKLTLP